VASVRGIPTLVRFFGKGIASEIRAMLLGNQRIRLIGAMSVLAHTDNINEVFPELLKLMDEDTIFVSLSHWLVALIRNLEFDTIYHEHLRYYTLSNLVDLYNRYGLTVLDAVTTDYYGGSILVYATKQSATPSHNVRHILLQEAEVEVIESFSEMKDVLLNNKARLLNLLVELKRAGKRVAGIGAPMKASTLLNFYNVTPDLIEYLAEVNPLKVGTVLPGVHIPVVDETILFDQQPDYALLLAWNMAKDIIPRYRSRGYNGKFILPVPRIEIVE
jgi:hypothetical protein